MWSPELYTLPSFMERLSGLRVLPGEELLLEAYEAYRTVAGGDARGLEDFLEWAPVTLADMGEADANLVGLDGFYRDLRSWEELDWSFNTEPLSEGQHRMVRYWALAGRLHAALNERLLAAGAGTSGLVARRAGEGMDPSFPWERIWFAGLNAFTGAEERVIDRARDAGVARFAWDADRYYLEQLEQESGTHLRKAIRRYGPGVIPVADALRSAGPKVEVMGAPNAVAQVWCAADRLGARPPEERARTAVVLADEGLLPALLGSLPEGIGPVNVTMGSSVAGLPVGSLLESFFKSATAMGGDVRWSVEGVLVLLGHPYLRGPVVDGGLEGAINALRGSGVLWMSGSGILSALDGAPPRVLSRAREVFAMASERGVRTRAMALLAWAKDMTAGNDLAIEQIYQASLLLKRTTALLERYGHSLDGPAWTSVMSRLLRTARVGFYGEPLAGLQVMGLLEARGLDPHHVILLSAQEGKLPASSIERSYIPFELRRAHGLPLRDSADAVQAYNFLRLLQRAEDALLVYDAQDAGGPSRYIAQFRHELFADRPERLVSTQVRLPLPDRAVRPIVVTKDQEAQARLVELLASGLTPTMLRSWLRCPLDFWFRHVCGLREPDAPGARIGADVLGNALHGALESLHRPWLNKPLEAVAVEEMIPVVEQEIKDRLLREVAAERMGTGQPLLQTGMAVRAAVNFLQDEARAVREGMRMTVRGLEVGLRAELRSAGSSAGPPVFIKGRLDRVDERDGIVHILDLKTGRVDDASLRVADLSIDGLKGDKGHAAQLLLYAWLYLSTHPDVEVVRAGLQPLQRAAGSSGVYVRMGDNDLVRRSDLPAITGWLSEVARALVAPDTVFAHDPESKYCAFCVPGP